MADEPDLSPGQSSEWVSYLQQMLNHHYQQSVVEENGAFDETTENVVRHLRSQNGLDDSSSVDSRVWALLTGAGGAASHNQSQANLSYDDRWVDDHGTSGPGDYVLAHHDGAGGAGADGNDGAEGHHPGTTDGAGSSADRHLNSDEIAAAYAVFQNSLDTSGIILSEGGVMAIGGYARTLPEHITFPAGTLSDPPPGYMHWLIHELAHCWQYQQGAGIPGLLVSALGGDYDYGGEQGLRDAAANGQPFADFGYEEQASIIADYSTASDTSAYDPYIAGVRDGTWRSAPQVAHH